LSGGLLLQLATIVTFYPAAVHLFILLSSFLGENFILLFSFLAENFILPSSFLGEMPAASVSS